MDFDMYFVCMQVPVSVFCYNFQLFIHLNLNLKILLLKAIHKDVHSVFIPLGNIPWLNIE